MSMEIPSALIRRIQATLRRNAAVPSSYDPADPSLPSLSSLDDAALASLDADLSLSSSFIRCSRCRRAAGLVRGSNSTLCIFCGRDRSDDGPAQSLSFNSTTACKKLLRSLQLDGSEVIDLDTESKDSNKGQDTQDNGLVLSSVLDLELKWPPEKKAAVNTSSDKAHESSQVVNLSRVDLDAFFSDSRNNIFSAAPSVTTEELMPSKQIISTKSHVSSGSDNFASFKDLQTPNIAVSSESTIDGGEFADWEAGFQSASSQTFHLESDSFDHFHGSSTARPASLFTDVTVSAESRSIDLFDDSTTEVSVHATPAPTFSEHGNVEHEVSNEGNSGESTNEWGQFSSSGDRMQGDLWGNPPDQLKSTSKTDDNELKDDAQCTTSTCDTWGQDEMWATGSTDASNSKSKHDDDNDDDFGDVLDTRQDFASSKEAPEVSSGTWIQPGDEITPNEHASVPKSVDVQNIEFGNFLQSNSFSGALGGQGGPDKVNNILLTTSASTGNIVECFNVKSINGNSLEACQDIACSNGASGDLSNLWTQTTTWSTLNDASATKSVNSQGMEFGGIFRSDSVSGALGHQKDPSDASAINLDASVPDNSTNVFDKTKQSDVNDDSLNDWQNVTSLKEALGCLPNSWTKGAKSMPTEHDLGVKPVDPRDQDFGGFLYSDFFSGVDCQKGPSHVNDIQLDALFSNFSTEFESGGQKDPSEASAAKLDAPVSSNILNEYDKTKESDGNDDSLDDWQGFSSSKEASGVSPNSWTSSAEGTLVEHAPRTKPVDPQERSQKDPSEASAIKLDASVSSNSLNEFDKTKQSDDNDDSLDEWQDFTRSKESSGVLPRTSNSWTSGAEATLVEHAPRTKPVDPQDSEFGSFVYSNSFSGDGQRGSTHVNDIQLNALVSNTNTEFKSGGHKDLNEAISIKLDVPVSSNSKNEFDKTKQSDDNDDSLDFWQDFISSNKASGVLPNSWTSGVDATSIKHAPGMKPVDPQDSEIDSFLCSDSFSGLGDQRVFTHVNDLQLDALFSNSSTRGLEDPGEASAIKLDAAVSSNCVNEFDKNKQSDDNEDSLDGWQDFTSSNEASGVLPNSWTSGAEATPMGHASGTKQVDPQDSQFGSFIYSDSFSGVDGQRCSTHMNDIQLDALVSNSSIGFKSNNNVNDNYGVFDSWKDFISSNKAPEDLSSLSNQNDTKATSHDTSGLKSADLEDMEFGDFLQSDMVSGVSWQGDSTKANDIQLDTLASTSSMKEFNNTREMDDNFDPFEAWQEFAGSTNAQESLASLSTQSDTTIISYEHASGTKSLDLQDMGFGSFLHPDSLSGALGDKKGSSEVNDT